MKINVTENKVSIKEEQILNENEYNIHRIQFDFSSEYTDDLVKVALFSIDNHTYKKIISNNECDIPPEVLTQRGYSILGVYAYKTEQDTLVLRYSPSPTKISVYDGSYQADAENSEPITPSEIEQYQQILQNSLQQFQNQYNALVEETEGDIQAIEDELQRKVDEGYFDGEDGFSPIAKVIQKSNGATIEIEDKNGKTTADVLNGEDGYTPVRGVDYWTEEDKQEVKEEATQQIEGKIEEYNENAAEKLNQYNQNSVQKTNDYNTNAEQKMSAYNTNATEKLSIYNSNAEQKETNYNTNASQKVESFNTNASSKLSEYNSNAETKKSAYDENATQKTNTFDTNATNKLNAYNTNAEQKVSEYNQNATQKTEDFDEHTEEIQDNIEILQRTDNQILSRFNKDEEVSGQDITLTGTTEIKFAKPPLPMGNSEQDSTTGANIFNLKKFLTDRNVPYTENTDGSLTFAVSGDYQSLNSQPLQFSDTDIAVSLQGLITLGTAVNVRIEILDSNNNWAGQITSSASKTENRTASKIRFNWGDVGTVTIKNVMLNIGSTAQPYEPYTNGASPNPDYPQEITNVTGDVEVKVQNKNRIKIDNSTYSNNGIQAVIQDGQITLNGTSTANSIISIPFAYKFNTQEYTISANNPIANTNVIIRFDNNVIPFELNSINKTYTNTFSEEKNVNYLTIRTANGTTLTNFIIKPQLEEGSTATTYTPHKEQVFTFPLGNEKLMLGDYLADDGIHHVRGQIVLDGTEPWQQYGNNVYFQDINRIHGKPTSGNIIGGFCTHTDVTTRTNMQYNSPSGVGLFVSNLISYWGLSEVSVNAWETWLSTHNVTVEYELNEEVIVPYTSAQQRVYNEIKNAYSYDEMTIITGSSDGNKPFFIVQAYKDLNKELNNKVDKVQGKELSSNDFTDTLKEKLEGLENYDDTEIKADISDIQEENARLKATLPTTTGEGQDVTLDKTAEMEFKKPPLPMGNSEQFSTTGKQILNLTTVTGGYNITQPALTNGIVHAQGNNSEESNTSFRNGYVEFKNTEAWETNTTYYVSMKIDILQNPKNVSTFLCMLFGDGNIGTYIAYNSTTKRYEGHMSTTDTVPTEANKKYIELRLASCELNISEILLSKSSDTSYEPYTGRQASPNPDYPQEITNVTGDVEVKVQNKNLWNANLPVFFKDESSIITANNNGGIDITLASTATLGYIVYDLGDIKKYKNKTITLSIGNMANALYRWCSILNCDSNGKNRTELANMGANNNKITLTIGDSYSQSNLAIRLYVYGGTASTTYSINNVQVELNSTATDWKSHQEQVLPLTLGNIELCKIGDYQDYFYKESNKWYLHKEIAKKVLNGSENYTLVSAEGYVKFTSNQLINNSAATGICISSHFHLGTNAIGAFKVYNNNWVDIFTEIMTLEEFKTWLSNNNVSMYYACTTTDTEITDTTLISQLEAINNALSYEEQTNISSNQNALFSVEAYQDIKEKIEEAGGHTHNNKAVLDGISSADITRWNNKSDFSGDYNDLSNKPTIPDVSGFITKDVNNLTNYTLKTNTGSLIDLEINNTTYVVTMKLKDVDGNVISTDTIDLPLETVVVSGRYDNTTKKVILTLENGSEVDFSVADLVAGLQTEITSSNKLASDLVDDTNSGNKFVTTSEKQTWNGKYDKPSTGIPKTDLASAVQTSLGKADTAIQSSDLTNYVTNTDYATAEKGGTIRTSNASGLGISNGNLYAVTKSYNIYDSASGNMFIGKGTLENVLIGKGLVSNTDYATYSNGGVIKVDGAFSTFITDGKLKCTLKTYGDYQNLSSYAFIGKGTLENVVAGKELDLKQLSTFDRTKTQVLKNINGTLTWVDES